MAVYSIRVVSRLQYGYAVRCLTSAAPQPAFVFHPHVKTTDPDHQAFTWTKTQLLTTPPTQPLREQIDVVSLSKILKKSVIFTKLFEHDTDNYPSGLVHNLLKLVLAQSSSAPQLRDLYLAPNVNLLANWKYKKQLVAVRAIPQLLITCRQPYPSLFSKEAVDSSISYTIPPSPIEGVTLFKDLNIRYVNECTSSGFYPHRGFPYLHTIIVPEQYNTLSEPQVVQKCIMYLYGSLTAQATERHGKGIIGMRLPEPECAQGIVTDGNSFTFVWYQLNTLDLSSTSGVKNLACVRRCGSLYSFTEKGKAMSRRVSQLDTDTLSALLAMLLWK